MTTLRDFFTQHQHDVIEQVLDTQTISMAEMSDHDRADYLASDDLNEDAEITTSILVSHEASFYEWNGDLVHFQVTRTPTIAELESALSEARNQAGSRCPYCPGGDHD